MRAALLALMAIITVSAIGTSPAEARNYPFCIKGHDWLSPIGDCSFTSYAQCQATASGRFAWCDTNPYQSYDQMSPRDTRRYHHRRAQY